MQKFIVFPGFIIIFLFFSKHTEAQLTPLTFNVRAANFSYYDSVTFTDPKISGIWNVMEYDIFIQQTNVPQNDGEIMRLALHQYYLNFNFGGLTADDSVGKYADYSYISGTTTLTNLTALPTGAKCVAIAASTDQGAYWPSYPGGILGGYLNLNSNNAMGTFSDVQISGVFPGTKVGRYRLKKNITAASPSPYFPSVNPHIRWRIAPAIPPGINSNPVSKVFCYNGLGGSATEVSTKGTYYIDSVLSPPVATVLRLNLKLAIEGLYYPIFGKMARRDQVKIIIRNTVSPFSIVDTASILIDSNTFSGNYQTNKPYGTYYVVVKHFNCVEEWSKSGGISFLNSNTVSYDFTSAKSQGYGDNLKHKGSYYCLFSGDIDQDGIIDASDLSIVSNASASAITGYSVSDLNADLIVDATDLAMVENNVGNGLIAPTGSFRSRVKSKEIPDNSSISSIKP